MKSWVRVSYMTSNEIDKKALKVSDRFYRSRFFMKVICIISDLCKNRAGFKR